jgi:hypothetical protein
MAIKFTDLPTANTLSADDLFAVTIDSTNVSQSVSFATLKDLVIDDATFSETTNLANMKAALNASNSGLNADLLDGQHGSHYLNYNNLTNKPTEKTDLHEFDNSKYDAGANSSGGFIKIRPSDNKIVFQKREGGVDFTPAVITTDNINEGINKFYTEDRVTEYFDEYFATYFNKYNVTFDQGNVNDSYTDTVGYAPAVSFSGETSTIRIKADGRLPGVNSNYPTRSQADRFASYQKGKGIRIYGADSAASSDALVNNATIASVDVTGFDTYDDNSVGATPTFNAVTGVNNGTRTITTTANHNLELGEAVIYSSGGAGAIPNLVDGQTYYVFNPSGATLQLVATPGSTDTVNIGTGTGTTHTLTPVEIAEPYQRITYTIAEWDMSTGKISPTLTEVSRNIGTPVNPPLTATEKEEYLNGNQNRILEDFSVENFVKLSFTHLDQGVASQGITPGRGICIYRRVAQVNTIAEQLKGEPKLIAVLGPLELKDNYWIDYFTDDVLTHSGKDQTTNAYIPENTVHFTPNELPSSGARGWVDATIDSVIYQNDVNPSLSTYIDVKLTTNIVTSAGEEAGVWISHDDTSTIQAAIDTNSATGRKAIQFNPKNYVVSSLSVPSNFSVTGFAYNTKLTKLPWSGWTGSSISSSGRMIKASGVKLENTSFVGFDIDGNSGNSIGFDDRTDIARNYTVDFGSANNSILLDKVRLKKPLGGGVYATDPVNLKVIGCEFLDSGITDRHVYSPLIADGGKNTSISSNRFENFSKGSVDCSITNQGAIEGNIISNCGSGLLAFGSRFMITSPNVLTGPAGEFLPQPDSFNSEFDSINVDLTEASLHANGVQSFSSGPFKYQENGEEYDLGNPGPVYKMFAIKKEPVAGEESIWIDDLRPPTGKTGALHTATFNATSGGSYDTSNDRIIFGGSGHGLNTGDVVYYSAGAGGTPQTSSGLVEGASYFVYAHSATQIELFTNYSHALVGTGASQLDFSGGATGASGTAHTLTRNSFLEINQGVEGDNPASKGGFQWTIPGDTVRRIKLAGQPYTIESMKDATKSVYHRDANGDFAMTQGDPHHVGIGWSASITQYVDAAMIVNNAGNPGVWTTDGTDHFYTVTVRDYKYLVEDARVKPLELGTNAHQNFDTGGSSSEYGIITDIGAGEEEKVITIRWPGANANTASGGNGGILQVENTFVIATGRIK